MALGVTAMLVASSRGAAAVGRLLGHVVALGAALVVVLLPLELLLRIPRVAREFGLPVERERQLAAYDSLWAHNVFRFRSTHEVVARRPGVQRLIALGDSFTWGLHVGSSDSVWPALLERELSSSGSPGVTEVINMGQRGWTTANEAEFLRRLGWQFAPDVVIVQFFVNDAYPSGPDFRFGEPPRIWLLPTQFWQGYIRSSALASLASNAINGIVYGLLEGNDESETLFRPDAEGFRQLRAALREIGDSAASRKVPVLFVLFPPLLAGNWTSDTYPMKGLYASISRHAREAGLHVLDLTDAFAAQGGDWARWWATPYDAHPSAGAHRVVATAIANYLRRAAWLQPVP